MKRSLALTVVLSLMIGCALSQDEMFTPEQVTPDSIDTSTMDACYDAGWSTKCECLDANSTACGYKFTTVCGGVETSYNTENMTRDECYVSGEWAEWSSCNVTCPQVGGWRNRTNQCDPASVEPWQHDVCNDSIVEWQECTCGAWAAWSEYSTCSATCDGGVWTRHRDCLAPATAEAGDGVVCLGDAEEEDACGTEECPLDAEEQANGVYVGLVSSMTVDEYIKIRSFLQSAIISMINIWCYKDEFETCCPDKTMPNFPNGSYVPTYVDSKTCELKGAFRDEGANTLYFFMMVAPEIDTNELCNGNVSATTTVASAGRKRRQTMNLAASITNNVASSSSFTSAVTSAASAQGFTVTVAAPLSASAAQSLKASLATTTAAVTVSTTRATATSAPQPQLGLIIGVSVGGGLLLVAIILIIVVVVKKKMAKTGIAEITASGEDGAAHHHERRHRELEDGNVAYPAPQYPARGAVAPVSHS